MLTRPLNAMQNRNELILSQKENEKKEIRAKIRLIEKNLKRLWNDPNRNKQDLAAIAKTLIDMRLKNQKKQFNRENCKVYYNPDLNIITASSKRYSSNNQNSMTIEVKKYLNSGRLQISAIATRSGLFRYPLISQDIVDKLKKKIDEKRNEIYEKRNKLILSQVEQNFKKNIHDNNKRNYADLIIYINKDN